MNEHPIFSPNQREDVLDFFRCNNYAVVSDGLTSNEIDFLNGFVEDSKRRIPEEWGIGTRDIHDHGQILVEHPQLDDFVQHPTTFPLVKSILGEDVRFAQFDFRELPDGDGKNPMRFHQDHSYLTRQNWDPNHAYQCRYLCRIFYLTDVTEETPCFSVVPNSHPYATAEEAKVEMDDYREIPIRGAAGTAILYNIAIYHARFAGTTDAGRRTQHTYYSRAASPVLTEWVLIPERLAQHPDASRRAFYSQWTPATQRYADAGFKND